MIVFVDGENFRQRLTDCLMEAGAIKKNQGFAYDVRGLLSELLGEDNLEIRYYASEIRTPSGYNPTARVQRQIKNIRESMRRWVAELTNQKISYIKAGNLKVKESKPCYKCGVSQEHLQEKGVDVRLALDIFEESLNKVCKEIAVVSSDTDICPVYHKIKRHGVSVKYICFARYLNRAVSAATDETLTISDKLAVKFLKKTID